MKKFLFFDYQQVESVDGFARQLEPPVKHPANPLFIADQPWENGNMTMYGSVIKAPGKPFQMWYMVQNPAERLFLAYAESEDGLVWRKPLLDLVPHEGKPTNLLLDFEIHGPAIIHDGDEPDEAARYKMLAGSYPFGCVSLFTSPDGIRWKLSSRYPVLPTRPDSPIGFVRCPDGRYLAYHRNHNFFSGRRICRSEAWSVRRWDFGDPGIVLEPDAGDPPRVEFYGMGSAVYGPYEIGTLWMFHTDLEERVAWNANGYQEAELTYARAGNCWHRAAQGVPFLPHGRPGEWDGGNLQCASQPVFLDDEIRYYYAGSNMRHKMRWELEPQRAGLGLATLKPDRFIALAAGEEPAHLLTKPFVLASLRLFVNACVEAGGMLQVALLDAAANPIPGFDWDDCVPLRGDSTAHAVTWRGRHLPAGPAKALTYVSLRARRARLYSIFAVGDGETPVYHKFNLPTDGTV